MPPTRIDPPVSFSDQTQYVYDPVNGCWRSCLILEGEPISQSNPLPVIANIEVGDIQIGAVELKDHDSSTRSDIEVERDYNALLVRDAIEYQKVRLTPFNSDSVGSGATLTLVSHTVGVGKDFEWTGVLVGGNASGLFTLFVNGSQVGSVRNSGSERTKPVRFPELFEATDGDVIEIKVTNLSHKTETFEATMFAFEVNQ